MKRLNVDIIEHIEYSFKGGSTANLSRYLKRKRIIQYEAKKKKRCVDLVSAEQDIDEPVCTISAESNISHPSTSTYIEINKILNFIPQNTQKN